ncbi:MAG: glycosyltransferase family 4 protein [Candidatus Paceibacterota bacterium]
MIERLLKDMFRVLILLPAPYPLGGAQTLRMQLFADGLRCAGCQVAVVAAAVGGESTEMPEANSWHKDSRGIDYLTVNCPHSCVAEKLREAVAWAFAEQDWDALLVYGPLWAPIAPSVRFARSRGVPVAADCTEWYGFRPWRLASAGYRDHRRFHAELRRFDGAVAISSCWQRELARLGTRSIRIPAVADTQMFQEISRATTKLDADAFTVGYFGALSRRNRATSIAAAACMARSRGLAVRIACFGHWEKEVKLPVFYRPLAKHYSDAIELRGWLSDRREALTAMASCDALVLLRGDNLASRACFPTRIPEFLLSGKPVITSAVGDIAEYLVDGENARLISPTCSAKALIRVFHELAAHRDAAIKIGRNGTTTAKHHFCHLKHGRRLAHFLRSLC